RRYATQSPAVIVLGGSSMFKHQHGWEPSRAISCLPALTGQLGMAGGGLGQRHGASPQSTGLADVLADATHKMPTEAAIPSHMTTITEALTSGRLDALLLFGTNMLSSFADANELARGLARVKLIVSYDLFMNATARRCADLVLPATAWLEDMGLKQTATHIYLMERALTPADECRSLSTILRDLAQSLAIANFFPWQDDEGYINALLAAQKTESGEPLTVAELRKHGGYWQKNDLSHIAYQEQHFHTPSQKIEFWSERAQQAGLSPLPSYTAPQGEEYPLRFCQGRTLTAFHSFFDEGQALPTLARANTGPQLWIHPQDAQKRTIASDDPIVIFNKRGQFEGRAHVTDDILQGVVWMRDGWVGINRLTSGTPVVPLEALDIVPGIPGGQAAYDSWVEVSRKEEN
ncbi:MAG TPA: molybdopterin dinucleotide binding domain-containing protein, partial [Ktedonobacteraceae bacterium]|nr:molybdopterin dinucleotide binding domain-containing protein [Ktedonobacteraceae bacterium]